MAPVPFQSPTVFKLHVYSQTGDLDKEVEIEGDTVIIGRSSDCHVVIDRKDISRRHARLLCGWVVDDLSSRNGTHVDGTKIDQATLVPSRCFEVGDPTSKNLVTIKVLGPKAASLKDRETSNPEVMEPAPAGQPLVEPSASAPDAGVADGMTAVKSRAALEAEAARYRYKCAKLELEIEQLRKQLGIAQEGVATGRFTAPKPDEKKRDDRPKHDGAGG